MLVKTQILLPNKQYLATNKSDNMFFQIYQKLLKTYGYQGWWPILEYDGENPTKTGAIKGYHPKNYQINTKYKYEISIGAILTQNTSWQNVEKAMLNLKKITNLNPKKIIDTKDTLIANAIKPAGYFNQKTKKIKIFTNFYLQHNLEINTPLRTDLLNIWGIGKETADSILLYAYNKPVFVVDAYTKRLFYRLKLITSEKEEYDVIKHKVEEEIKNYKDLNEFHALIVEHAKQHCLKKPKCLNCPLKKICNYENCENKK